MQLSSGGQQWMQTSTYMHMLHKDCPLLHNDVLDSCPVDTILWSGRTMAAKQNTSTVVCWVGEHQHHWHINVQNFTQSVKLKHKGRWGWGIYGLNGWGIYGLNGWGICGLNGWGIYGLHGWGIYGLNGWGIYGLNGWGIHGLHGWGIYGLHGWGIYGLNGWGICDLNGLGIYSLNGWGSYCIRRCSKMLVFRGVPFRSSHDHRFRSL